MQKYTWKMASNSLKNPGKILEFCGCRKVGTLWLAEGCLWHLLPSRVSSCPINPIFLELSYTIKSYIFSKCPINPIFSTKMAIFVNGFKHFQGMGYVSQLYVGGMASLHLMYHPVHAE